MNQKYNNNEPFTQVPNSIINNEKLSLAAKGLLAILLSNSSNWKTMVTEIYRRSLGSTKSQQKTMKELKKMGYVTQSKKRSPSTNTFDWNTIVHVNPITPQVDSPYVEKRPVEKRPLQNEPVGIVTVETRPINNTNTDNINPDNIKREKEKSIRKEEQEKPEIENEFNPPTIQEIKLFFESINSNFAIANAFFNEFQMRNWYDVKGNKVSNWKGLARYYSASNPNKHFEINADEKKLISVFAKKLYGRIYQSMLADANEKGNENPIFYFNDTHVIKCVFDLCARERLDTYAKLFAYLELNKANANSYLEFKKSLGLTSSNDKGTKYV